MHDAPSGGCGRGGVSSWIHEPSAAEARVQLGLFHNEVQVSGRSPSSARRRYDLMNATRLAQLLKTMRHRWVAEQFTMEMWLEAAQEFENEVNTWLNDLPPEFRMPAQPEDAPPIPPSPPGSSTPLSPEQYLAAQRCELAAFAKSLILKAYTPLLKKNPSKGNTLGVHARAAQLACSDAAHGIIDACYGLFQTFGASRPSSYVFYSFGRQIFAAAAISASIVIQNPASLVAKPAMKDLERARELMRDPVIEGARGYSNGGGAGATPAQGGESLHIVQLLYAKALQALNRGGGGSGSSHGTKRKHGELSSETTAIIPAGFPIPFAGGSLATGPPPSTTATTPPVPAPAPVTTSTSSAPPPKSRLRSATLSRRGGASSAAPSETGESSPNRALRLSPGAMDPPPGPASAGTAPPVLPSSGKATNAKERRTKNQAYPSISIRNRSSKKGGGGSSSTASRSHAGDESSDAASSTHASSIRGPGSIAGGGEEGDGKSDAGSARALSIKKRPGHPSASTSSFTDSPYRAPTQLPGIGDAPTTASSTASTPQVQHSAPYVPMQTDPVPPPTSSYATFMHRAPPGSGLSPPGAEYMNTNPSAVPSSNNSPIGSSAYMNPSTPYLSGSMPQSDPLPHQHQQQQRSYDTPMGSVSGAHSMNMSPSVSVHPTQPHGNMTSSNLVPHIYNHHQQQQQQQHPDAAHRQSYASPAYGSFSDALAPTDHAMPYNSASGPRDMFLQSGSAQDIDLKPFQLSTNGGLQQEIHSAPPETAPWGDYHGGYSNSNASQGQARGGSGSFEVLGTPQQDQQPHYQQPQHQEPHHQPSYPPSWPSQYQAYQ